MMSAVGDSDAKGKSRDNNNDSKKHCENGKSSTPQASARENENKEVEKENSDFPKHLTFSDCQNLLVNDKIDFRYDIRRYTSNK